MSDRVSRPQDPQQPWWSRPGGAPPPNGAPYHRPPGVPPQPPFRPQPPLRPQPPGPPRQARPPYPAAAQPDPPTDPQPRRQSAPPPRPVPVVDPNRYTLTPGSPTPHRAPAKRSAPRGRVLLIGSGAAIALAAAGVGLWQFMFGDTTVIRIEQAEAGVREILSDPINGYGANSISALRCNDGKDPSAAKGDNFTCAVEIDGTVRHVYVEFQDDKGTFAVDGPR